MNTVLALSGVVIKELYRRKDFYVLFVMTAVLTLMLASVNFFHDNQMVRHIKDIALLLIWVSALIIAVGTTARQLPAERENRTIFPLLAKPVTRAQVLLGKFAGCWVACALALVVFYVFFAVVTGSRDNHWPLGQYFEALWLQWVMLGVVIALVLLGSVVFSAPSANASICLVIICGILLLGRYLNQIAPTEPEPLRTLLSVIYFVIPHLEWYNVREFITFEQPLPGWGYAGLATLYALAYMAFLLFATWMVFRRKSLSA